MLRLALAWLVAIGLPVGLVCLITLAGMWRAVGMGLLFACLFLLSVAVLVGVPLAFGWAMDTLVKYYRDR